MKTHKAVMHEERDGNLIWLVATCLKSHMVSHAIALNPDEFDENSARALWWLSANGCDAEHVHA